MRNVSFDFGGYPKLRGSILFSRTKPSLQLPQSESSPGRIGQHSSNFKGGKLRPNASGFWNNGVWVRPLCPLHQQGLALPGPAHKPLSAAACDVWALAV